MAKDELIRVDRPAEECSDLMKGLQYEALFKQEEGERPLRVLSLFSGCGGMDLGLEGGFACHARSVGNSEWIQQPLNAQWMLLKRNRFRTVFACDILPAARLAWLRYMRRFGIDPSVYHLDSVVDLVKRQAEGQAVFPSEVDVVTGGFPCQDFSLAGKRKGFDSAVSHNGERRKADAGDTPSEETRGKLYMWMKQVIDIVRPKLFIAENVKGLVSLGDVKRIIQRDFSAANGGDYIVLDPQVLHAGNYGVPETRERVIFIGIRRSALTPEALAALEREQVPAAFNPYPAATHGCTIRDPRLARPVTCRDIFGDLPEPADSVDLAQQNFSGAKYMSNGTQGQTEILLDGLAPTIRSEHHGNIEFRRLSAEHGGHIGEELRRGLQERRLTPRECALIQTFPPDFPFVFRGEGSKRYAVSPSSAYKVIGNAVPPLLAYHIGRRLQEVWPLYFGG